MVLPQRWLIPTPDPQQAQQLAEQVDLSPLLTQVLLNRGISTLQAAQLYLDPTTWSLPDPLQDFPDLQASVDRLQQAIQNQEKVAICGDYDADGMTSTALLLRTLRHFQVPVSYDIPSRLTEGYGINERMVQDLAEQGVGLIITVDNGISAHAAIALAKALGLSVLITDHHDLPPELPAADAILNPKLIREDSPYRGLAGVGVAYLLACCLGQRLGDESLQPILLELMTLGTIADMAPLTGVNRYWVKQGLQRLPQSQILGIQALMAVTGLGGQEDRSLQPEAIGFGLGPRINAVGRLAQPRVVIELLTTEDPEEAMTRAQECEQLNKERQRLCQEIEEAALQQITERAGDLRQERVLTVLGQDWHHGVIGIVASRLLERFGAPVFIASCAEEEIRGSVRGIPEFNVFEALEACQDLFLKYGGHPAAGGFSMEAQHWPQLCERLQTHARSVLTPDQIQPLVEVDVEARLEEMTLDLFQQIQQLQPCGVGNREPIFWSRDLQVTRQRVIGKDQTHLKVQVQQGGRPINAVAWRGAQDYPWPEQVDLAYVLKANEWRGEIEMQLEVKGVRPSAAAPTQLPLQGQEQPTPPPDPVNHREKPALELIFRPAPPIPHALGWQPLSRLSDLLPECCGSALIYGYRRPHIDSGELQLHYDRPQSGHTYNYVFLWSWPPSLTHLSWLLASTSPSGSCLQVYVHRQVVPLVSADTLRRQLRTHLETSPQVDLLRLTQQWWLSPAVVVAGLRALGYSCADFDSTGSLAEELERMETWYSAPWSTVASQLEELHSL